GASLMIRTMRQLADVDPGCDPESVLAIPLELQVPFISPEWPQTLSFFDRLTERIEALPGVVAVTTAYQDPSDAGWGSSFTIEGEPVPEEGREPEAGWRPVGLDYFQAMGIPMLRGRSFRTTDDAEAAGAVVVNQAFLDLYLPNEPEPLGRLINKNSWWIEEVQQLRIIGVAGNVKFSGRHLSDQPALYYSHRQFPVPQMKVLVRTATDPLAMADTVRQTIWALDPDLPCSWRPDLGSDDGQGRGEAQRRAATPLAAVARRSDPWRHPAIRCSPDRARAARSRMADHPPSSPQRADAGGSDPP
ncbi:MAG: ABC transporter permease, partial [Acidobacteriota bacterium]